MVTKRKAAVYGDLPYEYTYYKVTKKALAWTTDLLDIKTVVEKECDEQFNSCLLNLYHDGSEGMALHCDGEKDSRSTN